MPEDDLRKLQQLIREKYAALPSTEHGGYQRSCLEEADQLIDKVIAELSTDSDRIAIHREVYRILILAAEGGAFGQRNEP